MKEGDEMNSVQRSRGRSPQGNKESKKLRTTARIVSSVAALGLAGLMLASNQCGSGGPEQECASETVERDRIVEVDRQPVRGDGVCERENGEADPRSATFDYQSCRDFVCGDDHYSGQEYAFCADFIEGSVPESDIINAGEDNEESRPFCFDGGVTPEGIYTRDVFERDEQGNFVYQLPNDERTTDPDRAVNEHGNLIPVVYERDENGRPVADEEGNYQHVELTTDENGNIMLVDQNGNTLTEPEQEGINFDGQPECDDRRASRDPNYCQSECSCGNDELDEGEECDGREDSACSEDERCNSRCRCYTPRERDPEPECRRDSDCRENQRCDDGNCVGRPAVVQSSGGNCQDPVTSRSSVNSVRRLISRTGARNINALRRETGRTSGDITIVLDVDVSGEGRITRVRGIEVDETNTDVRSIFEDVNFESQSLEAPSDRRPCRLRVSVEVGGRGG